MDSLTIERIATVHAHIVAAVVKTAPGSTLPSEERQGLLAQSCAEACALLTDWHGDKQWWSQKGHRADGPLLDVVPDQENYIKFLDPMFKDMMKRVRSHEVDIADSDIDEARRNVAATARHYPYMSRGQLWDAARNSVDKLRGEVCSLAKSFVKGTPLDPARQRAAWTLLKKVRKVLPLLALTVAGAMLSAGPHQMAQSTSEWAHEVANVIIVHHIAESAQPHLRIAPPSMGPGLR